MFEPIHWMAFIAFVLAMLVLDLFVLNRKAHVVSTREAAMWSAMWISLALAFGVLLWVWQGQAIAGEYLAGYLIEESLSVDNMFVFVLIFSYFGIPAAYQHRVLFWGILGALLMRGAFIFLGAALLSTFHWILYVFGAFLLITGLKMFRHQEMEVDPSENPVLRLMKRIIPITSEYHGQRLFVREHGTLLATPLFAALVVVETTDVVFAVDSIPAIFAVTDNSFVVFTSNVFAVLGLRALYFLLAGVAREFEYLKAGLAVILTFVGVKMLLTDIYHVPIWASLGVIASVIVGAILLSLWKRSPATATPEVAVADPFGLITSDESSSDGEGR